VPGIAELKQIKCLVLRDPTFLVPNGWGRRAIRIGPRWRNMDISGQHLKIDPSKWIMATARPRWRNRDTSWQHPKSQPLKMNPFSILNMHQVGFLIR